MLFVDFQLYGNTMTHSVPCVLRLQKYTFFFNYVVLTFFFFFYRIFINEKKDVHLHYG